MLYIYGNNVAFYIYTLELLLYNVSRQMTGDIGKLPWSLVVFFIILYRRCILDIKFLGSFAISCGTKITSLDTFQEKLL